MILELTAEMQCKQPDPFDEKKPTERRPRDCRPGKNYCLCRVQEKARQACIDKGEGWRYGC